MSMDLVDISKSTRDWTLWERKVDSIEKGLPSYLKHLPEGAALGPAAQARLTANQAGRKAANAEARSWTPGTSPRQLGKKLVARRSSTANTNRGKAAAANYRNLTPEGASSYKASGVGAGPELRTYESQQKLGTHIKPEYAAAAGGAGLLGIAGGGALLGGRAIARNRAAAQVAARNKKIMYGAGAGAAGLGGLALLNRD